MISDTRERRLRFAPPQPVDERIEVMEDDYLHWAAINRHGPLPAPFLHAYTPDKNYNAFQYRLTKLYNGSADVGPLLTRPQEQFNSYKARYQHIAHDLSRLSKSLLMERGISIIKRTDHFVHRLMGACNGSSIELAAPTEKLAYIPRTTVLAKKNASLGITVDGKTHVPDDLFGLRYPDGSHRFFAAEWDRNTECTEREDKVPNSIDKKYRGYLDIIYHEAFRSHWGIPNLTVLFITTNVTHKTKIMQHLDEITNNKLKKRFLFRTELGFGKFWQMPAAPMPEVLTEPWDSLVGPVHINNAERKSPTV